jgi:hypothetical protein
MRVRLLTLALAAAASVAAASAAAQSSHRSPCHVSHSCPSDHHTYSWNGLSCTSYASERRSTDTRSVAHGGRRYWCSQKGTASAARVQSASSSCHPSYKGACLDPNASDYDCAGGSGDGPRYTGPVRVVGSDPFRLDADGDGFGCD